MDQEMQFADPDWKPGPSPVSSPQSPQPVNWSASEQARSPFVEAAPDYEQNAAPSYAQGLAPQKAPVTERQYEPPVYQPQRRRGRGPWFWIILVILFFAFMGGGFRAMGGPGSPWGNISVAPLGNKSQADQQFFKVTNTPTIIIRENNGNIQVQQGTDSNSVDVQATRFARTFGDPNSIPVQYSQVGNVITITVDSSNTFMSDQQVNLTITTPQQTNVQFQTSSGDIELDGINGQASILTDSGNITTSNDTFSDNTQFRTASGEIQSTQDTFQGTTGIVTNSGDISLNQDTLGSATKINSTSGNIQFGGTISAAGHYEISTTSGNIDLALPSTANFQINASTTSGSVNSDPFSGITAQNNASGSGGAVSGSTGGGSQRATFTIQTDSGNISLNQVQQ